MYPLSTGGFGDVYRGKLRDATQVAIKTMRLEIGVAEGVRKYLKHAARELHIWSKCQHPNVLPLVGLVIFRDQIGMVSRWIERGNLPSYIKQNPGLDRFRMSADISAGLAYLHETGIVHGDLKGLNVLVNDDGAPMLTDFGNAVLQDCTLNFTATTRKNSLSPRWAAPELLDEREGTYSRAADVYALGMTALETFTGQVPYSDKSDLRVITTVIVLKEPPARPEAYIPSDSRHGDALWLLLKRCWANEPEERPKASEVAEIMHGFRKPSVIENENLLKLEKRLQDGVAAARATVELALVWADTLVEVEARLADWAQAFGRMVSRSDLQDGGEVIQAFTTVARGLETLGKELKSVTKEAIVGPISRLIGTASEPLRLLVHVHVLDSTHQNLVNRTFPKPRPATVLEASQAVRKASKWLAAGCNRLQPQDLPKPAKTCGRLSNRLP